jgi:hypothetical protein
MEIIIHDRGGAIFKYVFSAVKKAGVQI